MNIFWLTPLSPASSKIIFCVMTSYLNMNYKLWSAFMKRKKEEEKRLPKINGFVIVVQVLVIKSKCVNLCWILGMKGW